MLDRLRDLLSDIEYWLRSRSFGPFLGFVGMVVVACAIAAGYLLISDKLSEDDPDVPGTEAPAPPALVAEDLEAPTETSELGFPTFATGNTTRVGGIDPTSDAAGIAVATAPTPGVVPAVTLVDAEDWATAIAAGSLVAEPIGAPILLTEGGKVPAVTQAAFEQLAPEGSDATGGSNAFVVAGAAAPADVDGTGIEGADEAERAAGVARLRKTLTGEDPEHVVLVNPNAPGFAMPAALWAARTGDAVLMTDDEAVPQATLDVLAELESPPVYALGPTSVISEEALSQLTEAGVETSRIEGADPVANAIAFARYSDGEFGWNINDPGHGLILANAERPADAAAAAPLANRGAFGPLLLTDSATEMPPELESYLLDIKPGYADDPTRAVYNHVWVIGDRLAISVELQAQVDELAALTRVSGGTGEETTTTTEGTTTTPSTTPGETTPTTTPTTPTSKTPKAPPPSGGFGAD